VSMCASSVFSLRSKAQIPPLLLVVEASNLVLVCSSRELFLSGVTFTP